MDSETLKKMEEQDLSLRPPQTPNKKWIFKVVFLGSRESGKTKLIERYVEGIYNSTYNDTIGVDYSSKAIALGNNAVTFRFWDTAGAQRFNGLLGNYLTNMHAVFIVFDASAPKSETENIYFWYRIADISVKKELLRNSDMIEPLYVIIANKMDKKVNEETLNEGKKLAAEVKALYYEISVKNDVESLDVDNLMIDVAKQLTSKFGDSVQKDWSLNSRGDTLQEHSNSKNAKKSKDGSEDRHGICCCCCW